MKIVKTKIATSMLCAFCVITSTACSGSFDAAAFGACIPPNSPNIFNGTYTRPNEVNGIWRSYGSISISGTQVSGGSYFRHIDSSINPTIYGTTVNGTVNPATGSISGSAVIKNETTVNTTFTGEVYFNPNGTSQLDWGTRDPDHFGNRQGGTFFNPVAKEICEPISGEDAVENYKTSKASNSDTTSKSFVADPVNAATGSHVLERTIFSINGSRPISLIYRYDSLLGWSHNFEARLEVLYNNHVRIHWTKGRNSLFIRDLSNKYSSTEPAVKFDNLVQNIDSSYTLTTKEGTVYLFDSSGKQIQQKNRTGQPLDLAYDSNGNLSTITEPVSGKALTFVYTADGRNVDYISDPLGRKVTLSFGID